IGVFIWSCTFSFSQKESMIKQPYVDFRSYHLGFHLGLHVQDLFIKNSLTFYDDQYWCADVPDYSPGISLGIIIDKRIHSFFNIRFIPTMHLGTKKVVFKEQQSKIIQIETLHSYYLQLPVEIKYRAVRIHNYAPYLTAGGYGIYDLGKQKYAPMQMKRFDYGITIGIGCDFYFRYFKFCPEVRFNFGLRDILRKPTENRLLESPFLSALSGAKSRMIMIVFNFE
ncbi:MAG: PorT family protein, partial [Tannerellaceae bacterium]|nr:PorT family protein [Tannerellaceae bacterium]